MAIDALATGAPTAQGGATRAAAPLVRQLWLDVFRVVVLGVILVLTLAILPGLVMVWAFYLAYLPIAGWAVWQSAHGRYSTWRLWVFMVIDTLLVTFLAHLIGTSVTPTGIGYMVVLVAYGLLGGRGMAWICALVALGSMGLLLGLEHARVLEPAPLLAPDHPAYSNPGGAPSAWLFIVVFLTMIFAWLSYVVRRIMMYHRRQRQSLVARQEALAKAARMQRALEQANRLEGLGRLSGNISHDFNNILTVIKGFTKEILDSGAPSERLAEDLGEVLSAAERAQALVANLLAFSRRRGSDPVELDLNRLVEEARPLLEPALGDDIAIELDPFPSPLVVRVDLGQLEQLLVALAVNARDALEGPGKVVIRTRRMSLEPDDPDRPPDLAPGEIAELRFEDDGPGMPPDVRARVFEPFYTTKPPGQGTGLGLSVAYGIARQNGGDIRVRSRPGEGTVFTLLLPCSMVEPRPAEVTGGAREP